MRTSLSCLPVLALAGLVSILPISSRLAAQDDPFAGPVQDPTPKSAGAPAGMEATHLQTAIVKVVDEGGQQLPLHTFCLSHDGKILAGVGEKPGAIRVYDADGKYLASWAVTIKPEAINVGPDGSIYVSGSGKMQKLDTEGKLILEQPAPHARQLKVDEEKLRQQVIDQVKQRAEAYARYPELFRQQIAKLEEAVKKIEEKGEADLSDEEKNRSKLLKQQIEMYGRSLKQYEEMAKKPADLTDEQIQQQVDAMIEYKARVSSVSATETDVFLTCPALEGYGFDVWRMDGDFANPEKIVTGLRGCCGQMDVQASKDGVFVAENARHRVCRYDREGNMQCEWGSNQREGLEGFGSCCNPMNLAFGPGAEVFTAESTSGRIKRYSPDGQLRGLVGSVEIVPGCKKVSIAVSQDGSRVYMLDITRTHIVVMSRKPAPQSGDTAAN